MKISTFSQSIILAKMIFLLFPPKTTSVLSLRERTSWHSITQHNSIVHINDTMLTPLTYIYSIIYTYFHLGKPLLKTTQLIKGLPIDKVTVNL